MNAICMMTVTKMSKQKYSIGDRLQYQGRYIGLIIRGVMMTSIGYRYFIEVERSDNSFTLDDREMDLMIERCATDPYDY